MRTSTFSKLVFSSTSNSPFDNFFKSESGNFFDLAFPSPKTCNFTVVIISPKTDLNPEERRFDNKNGDFGHDSNFCYTIEEFDNALENFDEVSTPCTETCPLQKKFPIIDNLKNVKMVNKIKIAAPMLACLTQSQIFGARV